MTTPPPTPAFDYTLRDDPVAWLAHLRDVRGAIQEESEAVVQAIADEIVVELRRIAASPQAPLHEDGGPLYFEPFVRVINGAGNLPAGLGIRLSYERPDWNTAEPNWFEHITLQEAVEYVARLRSGYIGPATQKERWGGRQDPSDQRPYPWPPEQAKRSAAYQKWAREEEAEVARQRQLEEEKLADQRKLDEAERRRRRDEAAMEQAAAQAAQLGVSPASLALGDE